MGVGRALVEEYFSALQNGNVAQLAGLFAEDGSVHEPFYRKEVRGRKAIQDYFLRTMDAHGYEVRVIKEYNDKVIAQLIVNDHLTMGQVQGIGTFFIDQGKIRHVHVDAPS